MKRVIILFLILFPLIGFSQILRGVIGSDRSADPINIADSITASIVSIYQLDETEGTYVNDDYGTNNGDNQNAIINQSPLITDFGKAYQFDGTNSYVDFNTQLIDTFPFSFSAWIRTDTTTQQFIFSSNVTLAYPYYYYGVAIEMTSSNISVSYGNGLGSGSGQRKSYVYNYTFQVDTIYHIIVTATDRTSTATKIYINNSEVAYSSTSGTATTTDWTVGESMLGHRWSRATTERFKGKFDLVVISDTTFTSDDRAFLYSFKN